jgi:hypothetical protein
MANYSIPNSTPAIGRTSTILSGRLRKQNSASAYFSSASILAPATGLWPLGFFSTQRPTLNSQRAIQTVRRWMFGVERWAFSFRRVKGAWWSSRSSKPLSVPHTRDRGRFDSYPLRHSIFDLRFTIYDCARSPRVIFFNLKSKFEIRKFRKGGESLCRESKSEDSLRFHPVLGELLN